MKDWQKPLIERDEAARKERREAAELSHLPLTERWKRQDDARKQDHDFYDSAAWLRVRYQVLLRRNACCDCCGARGSFSNPLQVDHVKPRSKFPQLALEISNLQILCRDCNFGKGAWDQTDWRSR